MACGAGDALVFTGDTMHAGAEGHSNNYYYY
jgi:ectoine hydroxylase-related dioxygenase (phytanoyl-CoA dioxygenase family)